VKKSLFSNNLENPSEFKFPEFNNLRLLGRPRVGKHEAKADFCTTEGEYKTQVFTKRKDPEIFKRLKNE
jgi:hypothetical protein